jgi:Cas6b C-terminal domain/Cas6b N-terminal domain
MPQSHNSSTSLQCNDAPAQCNDAPSTLQPCPITTITFPEIKLRVRDAHKLRGYFGNVFKEHSPLLHNHFETEESSESRYRYAYPLVQYKVLGRVPTLVGIGEAAALLVELFLKIKEIDIERDKFSVLSKYISHHQAVIGLSDDLHSYRFETLWLGLNQKNYEVYKTANEDEQQSILKRTLTANILTLCEAAELNLSKEQRIMVKLNVTEPIITNFKNTKMLGFGGTFTTNALLPNNIGLGKSVSRGFGSILAI